MGVVVNGATDIGVGLGKAYDGAGIGGKCPLRMVGKPNGDKLGQNAAHALELGSKTIPVLSECRDIMGGFVEGDLNHGPFNGAMLALYYVAGASNGGMKVGVNSASRLAKAAAVGAVSHTL